MDFQEISDPSNKAQQSNENEKLKEQAARIEAHTYCSLLGGTKKFPAKY